MDKAKENSSLTSATRMDMLHGPLFRKILVFALPLVASGILQQSFNAVDVAVVGRFSSSQALAAVGSNGVIINIMINLFIGISIGANVVIANYIGQKNADSIKRSIHTAAAIALVSGVFLMVFGMAMARPILELMKTPDDVIDLATLYLRLYFIGMPFMMIYNFGAAIMRSMGDTKRPFYSLVVAGIINTGLNLVLVIVFGMSVEGVAIATVVSNIVNAAFIVCWLRRERAPFTLEIRNISIHRSELVKMLKIGVPAGLQGMVFSIANIFIQSSINEYGSAAVAGSAAALTYESYCYYVIVAFCQAAVAFISQNYGAGQYDRCRRVYRLCMIMAAVSCGALNLLIVWQGHLFIGLFTTSPEVYSYALTRLQCVLSVQFIAASYEISGAAMRGLGYSMTPTVLTVFGTCVLRLIWVYTVNRVYDSFEVLLYIYPISWVVTGIAVTAAYFIVSRRVFSRPVRAV